MAPFSISGGTSFSIAPGQSVQINVAFQPQLLPDVFSDQIVISSNDPGGHPVTVMLMGYAFDRQATSAYGTYYYRECSRPAIPGGGSLPLDAGRVTDACKDNENDFEIDPAWINANISPLFLAGCGVQPINNLARPAFIQAFRIIGADPFLISQILDSQPFQCGTFAQRYIDKTVNRRTVSNHSWGAAIDMNADTNARGFPNRDPNCQTPQCPGIPSAENINLWSHAFLPAGFFWGANYDPTIKSDPMHFELFSPTGSMVSWLYRYVFRGIGILLVVVIVTILFLEINAHLHQAKSPPASGRLQGTKP
jgi:hypothetical protein